MATQKAHGHKLAEFEKLEDTPNDDLTVKQRHSIALMSDYRLLTRFSVWFKPDAYSNGKARYHDYGWKLGNKIKDGITVDQVVAHYQKRGFTVTRF